MTEEQEFSSPMEFPCDFTIKVMGKANDAFETAVLNIVRVHFPDLPASAITQRKSKDSTYLSLSIQVQAESRQQLDAIYQDLTDEKLVLMAL